MYIYYIYRPVFIHLCFENAIDSWNAYETLLNSLNEINNDALVLTRRKDEKIPNKSIIIHVNWTKTQWYKEYFNKSSSTQEKYDYLRSVQIANRNNLNDNDSTNTSSSTSSSTTHTTATTATTTNNNTNSTNNTNNTNKKSISHNNNKKNEEKEINEYELSALGMGDHDYSDMAENISNEIMQYFEKSTKKVNKTSRTTASAVKSSAFLTALNLATKRQQKENTTTSTVSTNKKQ